MTTGDAPCIIGVGSRTWHPSEVGGDGAPEPLVMWDEVVRAAAADAATAGGATAVLDAVEDLEVVYCQTTQYDDAPRRLADALGIAPARTYYSGIGGTTPQQLVNSVAARMLDGELDVAVVVSGEALATQQRLRKAGTKPQYSHRPAEKRPFPWEAPFHPSEVAHDVFQAWLTFACFDNARRAARGEPLDAYRRAMGEMLSPMSAVAARNPEAWFPVERTAADIAEVRPDNRLVGYPYTKYMVSVMDVDMAAALVIATDSAADRLGVPKDRRVYLRGWCYATDPVYVAEHDTLASSPAMAAACATALDTAGLHLADVDHLDLYSCFPSSLNFARDALGLATDDSRPLTVTGGLPYHGGAASGYMTHSIAQMVRTVRERGGHGLVTGVGMHMTKHVAAVYSATPAVVTPPDEPGVQRRLDAEHPRREIVDAHDGEATIVTYSVVHGRDGQATHAVVVCELADGRRCYAQTDDRDVLSAFETVEPIGSTVSLRSESFDGPMGPGTRNFLATR